jgi:hypothetical protein
MLRDTFADRSPQNIEPQGNTSVLRPAGLPGSNRDNKTAIELFPAGEGGWEARLRFSAEVIVNLLQHLGPSALGL